MISVRHALQLTAGLGCLGIAFLAPTTVGHLVVPARLPAPALSLGVSPMASSALGDLAAFLHPTPISQRAPVTGIDAITQTTGSLPPQERRPAETVLAYAPAADPATSGANPALAVPPAILAETAGLREAIAAYRAGDLAAGDAAAATTTNPVARAAAEWSALRLLARPAGLVRIAAFLTAHPEWPAAASLRRRAEEFLYMDKVPAAQVRAFLAGRLPETPLGRLALARSAQAEGNTAAAASLVRVVWRNADLTPALETSLRKEFPDALTRSDHKARADRLFYKDAGGAALRAATLAGPDVAALEKVREDFSEKAAAALTPELQKDPTLQFARIQKLRHDGKIAEAAKAMNEATRNPLALVNPDEWWIERRLLARKLLDLGDAAGAFRLCAEHSAQARDLRIEAEFHAGWIALRFLSDPAKAAPHFEAAAALAETPISNARAAYWQGRTAQAAGADEKARSAFEKAASLPTTYYGQLALARLGQNNLAFRKPAQMATGNQRMLAIRVIEMLEALDLRDLATPLAIEAARSLTDESQIAALSAVVSNAGDARASLMVGKFASQRGFALEEDAFPTFGIPRYDALARSAPTALVYAIARQESSFDTQAQSGAGAKGLMQMLPSTSKRRSRPCGRNSRA